MLLAFHLCLPAFAYELPCEPICLSVGPHIVVHALFGHCWLCLPRALTRLSLLVFCPPPLPVCRSLFFGSLPRRGYISVFRFCVFVCLACPFARLFVCLSACLVCVSARCGGCDCSRLPPGHAPQDRRDFQQLSGTYIIPKKQHFLCTVL